MLVIVNTIIKYIFVHTKSTFSWFGDGLYHLKRGDAMQRGEGLILGSNTPQLKTPILGRIL